MTNELKALKACAEYARLNAEIRRLTNSITANLSNCAGVSGSLLSMPSPGASDLEWKKHSEDITHLKDAFRPEIEDDSYSQYTVYMSEREIRDYLGENCAHCLAAYENVIARKAARRSLGATKRFITMIGRKANKEKA